MGFCSDCTPSETGRHGSDVVARGKGTRRKEGPEHPLLRPPSRKGPLAQSPGGAVVAGALHRRKTNIEVAGASTRLWCRPVLNQTCASRPLRKSSYPWASSHHLPPTWTAAWLGFAQWIVRCDFALMRPCRPTATTTRTGKTLGILASHARQADVQVPCTCSYSSWAVEGMVVTGKFRRAPDPSCSYVTVANVHFNNQCAKRRSSATFACS